MSAQASLSIQGAGHQENQPPGYFDSSQMSPAHVAALIRWFNQASGPEVWGLSLTQQCSLLGGIPVRTFSSWKKKEKNGEHIELSRDVIERFSLLLGIYKALNLVAPAGAAHRFFGEVNNVPLFGGLSIKGYLLTKGSMLSLYTVRRYLDGQRG